MKTLTLYSRPGCHLCESLIETLLPTLRGRADLRVVDIDGDEALRRRYNTRIPVLCDGERLIGEGAVDKRAVIRWLMESDV